jgi:hypothetical protein
MGRNPSSATQAVDTFKGKQVKSYITIAHVWMKYPDAMNSITERLRGVIIENDNALDVISRHDSEDTAFYVDPPYLPSTRDAGKDYRFEMSEEDHIKLASTLNEVKGKVILSGYPSELYDSLYKGWERIEKDSIANGHLPRKEMLWLRNIETSIWALGGERPFLIVIESVYIFILFSLKPLFLVIFGTFYTIFYSKSLSKAGLITSDPLLLIETEKHELSYSHLNLTSRPCSKAFSEIPYSLSQLGHFILIISASSTKTSRNS